MLGVKGWLCSSFVSAQDEGIGIARPSSPLRVKKRVGKETLE